MKVFIKPFAFSILKGRIGTKFLLVINRTSADERPSLIAILVKGKKISF